MGGSVMSGPFMRLDGFLSLCHDFQICARVDGKGGPGCAPSLRASENFLLRPHELRALFALAAGSFHRPALVRRTTGASDSSTLAQGR